MGYTTDFVGKFDFDTPLNKAQVSYLLKFSETRRMGRDEKKLKLKDPLREAVGLPLGKDCEFFVGGKGFMGQDNDSAVIDYNNPPPSQPSLWCQWIPTKDGKSLIWNGGEKFYNYVEWLNYHMENFFIPWGKSLTGAVFFQGEEQNDNGFIVVRNNKIEETPVVSDCNKIEFLTSPDSSMFYGKYTCPCCNKQIDINYENKTKFVAVQIISPSLIPAFPIHTGCKRKLTDTFIKQQVINNRLQICEKSDC